jgi:hypothetical protein
MARGDSACSARVGISPQRRLNGRPRRSGDWSKAGGNDRVRTTSERGEGESMADMKAIRKKIGNIEGDLKKRVVSLEKDLINLVKKLEKKENEVKRLKEKMTSTLVKSVKKKVKKAKKKVAKRLTNIF